MSKFTFNKIVTESSVNFPLNFVFNNDEVDETLQKVESEHLSNVGRFVNNVEVHVDSDECSVGIGLIPLAGNFYAATELYLSLCGVCDNHPHCTTNLLVNKPFDAGYQSVLMTFTQPADMFNEMANNVLKAIRDFDGTPDAVFVYGEPEKFHIPLNG